MTNYSDKFNLTGESALKSVFRNHASGIAVVTSRTKEGEPIGFTASSITSLGSNPPLVSLNIAQGSSSYPHLQIGTKVAIHTLDQSTLNLAKRLAGPKEHRFDGSEQPGPYDLPIFEDAPAVLIGEVLQRFEVESNAVVIIATEMANVNRIPEQPLVYFQRGWHAVGKKLSDKD